MSLQFRKLIFPQDRDLLVGFLTSKEWPFHVNCRLKPSEVEKMIDEGLFDGSNHESHWVLGPSNAELGLIRIFDLDDIDDGYPMFDLRILGRERGQGVGRAAVEWLSEYLFAKYPNLDRIGGTTRADNKAMRKVFRSCFFVKEGHYRKDWPGSDGMMLDTVKYGLLREDWENKSCTFVDWNDEN